MNFFRKPIGDLGELDEICGAPKTSLASLGHAGGFWRAGAGGTGRFSPADFASCRNGIIGLSSLAAPVAKGGENKAKPRALYRENTVKRTAQKTARGRPG
jgi:hypothetical protein